MTDQEIEQLVLQVLPDRERKVAFVIAQVGHAANSENDEFYLRVEKAIRRLVARGVLEVAGNASNWRHSEIKKISS